MSTINSELVPLNNPNFVPFGCYDDVKMIIERKMFYPFMISGETGNGKTHMIEQACHETGRELVRVNITVESDEDSLMGGFRLENANTVYHKGPVLEAMERGAVLLLDEIDLGSPARIMCLQSILEGKPYFIKRTGEFVEPKPGFTIVATANTKGRGDEDGNYVATNFLNEAFLERFAILFEHDYPPRNVEVEILKKHLGSLDMGSEDDIEFADILTKFAEQVRKSRKETAGFDHTISTRRLIHIINSYSIFGRNRKKALDVCLSRFDEHHKTAFMQAYKQFDPVSLEEEAELRAKDDDMGDIFNLQPFS